MQPLRLAPVAFAALTLSLAAQAPPAAKPAISARPAPIPKAAAKAAAGTPAAAMDALLGRFYKADQPGAAVLVMKEGKVVFRKAYGLASVELGVPLQADMVFRIGSITKQFTAAAVMTLVEEGKVDLEAPIGRYLKDLPAAWEKVTVTHLLNHTSGIASYTGDPTYAARMREDLTPAKILDRVRERPLSFEPGARHRYNNTGYVLLGMLVEQVAGQPYAAFLQKRFFEPLGLKHTRYGTETDLIPGHVQGYTAGAGTGSAPAPAPAPYLSMTQPYAAGALVSTVEDLARWNEALHGGKVVKSETLARMTARTRTGDGQEWPYGFGLASLAFRGKSYVQHGGGINGFSSFMQTDPKNRTVAVILSNTDRRPIEPEYLTLRLLALAAGETGLEPKAVPVAATKLARLAGRYQAGGPIRTLRMAGEKLVSQVGDSPAFDLIPVNETEFAFADSDTRLRFVVEGDKVLGVHRSDYQGEGPLQKRVEAGDERRTVSLEPAAFDAFAGQYELAPGFILKFWRDGARFFTQATGQSQAEIFPASPTTFFLKVTEAEVEFMKDADGKVKELVLTQGGQKSPAKRMP